MLGDIAWAASPTSTTRPCTHGRWATSSIGAKYGGSAAARPFRTIVGTGSANSPYYPASLAGSPPVGSVAAGALTSA
jgi:hypothetical protein